MLAQVFGMGVGVASSYAAGKVMKLVFEKLIASQEGQKLILRFGMAVITGVVSSAVGIEMQKHAINTIKAVENIYDNVIATIQNRKVS